MSLMFPMKKVKIKEAIRSSLTESFKQKCQSSPNPYWMGDAGPKIADVLSKTNLNQKAYPKTK